MKIAQTPISLRNAVHLKSAELWLKLGDPGQALWELQHLPNRARRHPWAVQILRSIFQAIL